MFVLPDPKNQERVPILVGNTLLKELGAILDLGRQYVVFANLPNDIPRPNRRNERGHMMFDLVAYLCGGDPDEPLL